MRFYAYILCVALLAALGEAASTISAFTSSTCSGHGSSVTGPNNGVCQAINVGTTLSVRASTLDSGCTITVYSDPDCSINATAARLNSCTEIAGVAIGSFSVDNCAPAAQDPVSSSTIVLAQTTITVESSIAVTLPPTTVTLNPQSFVSVANSVHSVQSAGIVSSFSTARSASSSLSSVLIASLSSIGSSTTATLASGQSTVTVTFIPNTVSSASALPTSTPVPSPSHTGTIAGAVVGGILALLILAGGAFWWTKKHKRENNVAYELAGGTARYDVKKSRHELAVPQPPPPPPMELDANPNQKHTGQSHELLA